MENIATCPNGHNYDATAYSNCPYCPNSEEKTVFAGNTSGNFDGITIKADNNDAGKTQIVETNDEKTIAFQNKEVDNQTFVPRGTRIISPEGNPFDNDDEGNNRKVVGFLVSYDINPNGKTFKIYEGKNLIGADATCDIVVSNDTGISGKHLTILFRSGVFRFRDEFSTNGSFINGQMQEDGKLDGASQIKIGGTRFIFVPIPSDFSE